MLRFEIYRLAKAEGSPSALKQVRKRIYESLSTSSVNERYASRVCKTLASLARKLTIEAFLAIEQKKSRSARSGFTAPKQSSQENLIVFRE